MSTPSRRALRERFDDAHHPPPQRPPISHHREWYLATDGSMINGSARIGAILESMRGRIVGRWHRHLSVPDNNAAEVAALHFGLDLAASRISPDDRLGVLLDHDQLANAAAVCATADLPPPIDPPCGSASHNHWGGIVARISQLPDIRIGIIDSTENPAHSLVNGRIA